MRMQESSDLWESGDREIAPPSDRAEAPNELEAPRTVHPAGGY